MRAAGQVVGPVEVGPVAHGGHCVARLDVGDGGPGRVVFVRHALPGERVLLTLTDTSHARFWRADATEVLDASPERVAPPCRVAGPGLCGGCDWQHASRVEQRRLKTAVVAEQLQRLAGLTWTGEVEAVPVPGSTTDDGLGWRTRMRYHADDDGRAALRVHRSNDLVAIPEGGCPIASPRTPTVTGQSWRPGAEVVAGGTPTGSALVVDRRVVATTGDADPDGGLTETVHERAYAVPPGGFWQVHPAAASVLVDAVLAGLAPAAGERAFDLYCGVGLFAGALADAGCQVWGLESGRAAVAAARRNLADLGPRARFTADDVERALPRLPEDVDLVVLDPPRSGAGAKVVREIVRRRPRAIAYVACDPAALARDLAGAAQHGYAPTSIRGFDLFPMTQHVECVVVLEPDAENGEVPAAQ
ncbi:tRNA/tmRNA/rRNA uracil-C5-methylase (TrmA/RlmC/RlmD family) [Friedmanniella antarctica]|uniref:tRNA/tmRNA/rRNA uracil-C5-methylase (TrmA/RlmC/RlmD family) n=1 Tax=Microlunatus antarcticus TaxID=53388 RepID=A0A7W5JVT8_9ACTN|nr:tRNA/tmRNA/rRNA uracil-C5-methylase (TrmA/RlmC/RlmD family) [Microlunatus antarcticus]